MNNSTSNMIENRMQLLEGMGGKLNPDESAMATDEYQFLEDLWENEQKRAMAIAKAAKLADRLTGKIENMDLDCDWEVYDVLCDITNLLEGR